MTASRQHAGLTLFGALIKQTGLSHTTAAEFLGLAKGTVAIYCYAQTPPEKHLNTLYALAEKQREHCDVLYDSLLDAFISGDVDKRLGVKICKDDFTALQNGFPSKEAYNVPVYAAVARLPRNLFKRVRFIKKD